MTPSMFNRDHRKLFGIGHLEGNSSADPLFESGARTVASSLKAQRDEPACAARFDQIIRSEQPDLSGGIRFVTSKRMSRPRSAKTESSIATASFWCPMP
jgi:hypothetical protein